MRDERRSHKSRKDRRSLSPDSSVERSSSKAYKSGRRSRSGSSEDRDKYRTKKSKHHHYRQGDRDYQPSKERDVLKDRPNLSPDRRELGGTEKERSKYRERDRDGNRERNTDRDRFRDHSDGRTRIKEEQRDDSRERNRPSFSKWDDDEDRRSRQDKGAGRPIKGDPDWNDERGGRQRGGSRFDNNFKRNQRRPVKREEEDTSNMEWGKKEVNGKKEGDSKPQEKDKPNFKLSGKLTEDRNTYKGVVIKYSEPPEARIPKRRWRLYPFKGDDSLPTLYIHRQSAYLMGRDRKIVDIPIDHPSCSKQHAALQYRLVHYDREDGTKGKRIRPYIIDLESANGTFVNNNKIEPRKYVELLERDVVKFGFSSREYVLLHEHSKGDDADDDHNDDDNAQTPPTEK